MTEREKGSWRAGGGVVPRFGVLLSVKTRRKLVNTETLVGVLILAGECY
jgi:hypothetical protein